ncbi:S1 family peptidase [Pseudobdellovibrio exovorus]|uniref:Peptidase S1 domain-containing protein n=1 Tax=Pseudobdellovibrio exovorus JSS TaxID=1184267 RepID=M4V4U3_9BACT|nr:trypsin-like serine protease [Pseudobdellovibrio exovorus]AGH94357.1 hypothetical protein A11Q_137 [Pseudobdellovibrio exovorus JSS]
MLTSQKLKFSLVAALSVTMLSACGNQSSSKDGQIASNIVGGTTSTLEFQKANGIVALLSLTEKKKEAPAEAPKEGEAALPQAANDNEEKPEVGMSICTGSLISKRVILTAAHCVDSEDLKGVLAIFATDISAEDAPTKAIPVGRVELHPDYDGQNDMALVFLRSDAPADFKLAKLPSSDITSDLKGKSVTLAGYGVTTPLVNKIGIDPESGELVVIPLPTEGDGVLRQISDIETLAISPDAKEFMVSNYGGTKGACHGDSGGPAYLAQEDGSFLLVGVTSRGTNPIGNCDRQAIYGSVAAQMDWIRKFVK